MATATFDKRIIIKQKEAEFLAHELDKKPIGAPKLSDNFIKENERKVIAWLSNTGK